MTNEPSLSTLIGELTACDGQHLDHMILILYCRSEVHDVPRGFKTMESSVAEMTQTVRLQAEEHPLEYSAEFGSFAEYCLHLRAGAT